MRGPGKAAGETGPITITPTHAIGWWAVAISILGIAAWLILPEISLASSITGSLIALAVSTLILDLGAVLDALCIMRWNERSVLVIITAILTIPQAFFLTFMVIGQGLGGIFGT